MGYQGQFKVRYYVCRECGEQRNELAWQDDVIACCDQPMKETSKYGESYGSGPAIHGDEIDQTVEHGVCHEDGRPRRFTSRAELNRALDAKGLVRMGDTPKVKNRWV